MNEKNNNFQISSNNCLEEIFKDLKPIELQEDNTLITFPGMLVPVHLQRESQAIIYFETYKPEINTVKYEELFN